MRPGYGDAGNSEPLNAASGCAHPSYNHPFVNSSPVLFFQHPVALLPALAQLYPGG